MENLEKILTDHPFFKDLNPRYIQLLTECAKNVHFKENKYIFREGEQANHFYLIREGKVALELFAAGQGSLRIQTIDSGEVFGWSWLFPPYLCHSDARAIEPTRLIAMNVSCLRPKCEIDYELGYNLMKRFAEIMMQRLQATRMQLLEIRDFRHTA